MQFFNASHKLIPSHRLNPVPVSSKCQKWSFQKIRSFSLPQGIGWGIHSPRKVYRRDSPPPIQLSSHNRVVPCPQGNSCFLNCKAIQSSDPLKWSPISYSIYILFVWTSVALCFPTITSRDLFISNFPVRRTFNGSHVTSLKTLIQRDHNGQCVGSFHSNSVVNNISKRVMSPSQSIYIYQRQSWKLAYYDDLLHSSQLINSVDIELTIRQWRKKLLLAKINNDWWSKHKQRLQ